MNGENLNKKNFYVSHNTEDQRWRKQRFLNYENIEKRSTTQNFYFNSDVKLRNTNRNMTLVQCRNAKTKENLSEEQIKNVYYNCAQMLYIFFIVYSFFLD